MDRAGEEIVLVKIGRDGGNTAGGAHVDCVPANQSSWTRGPRPSRLKRYQAADR